MSKIYLMKSDCKDTFEKGTLLILDNKKLIEVKTDRSIEISDDLANYCIEISPEHYNKVICMSKEERVTDDFLQKIDNKEVSVKQFMKYHEEVIIDPLTISTWKIQSCDSMNLGDHAEFTLRDSNEKYRGVVLGLGKANDIDAVALKLISLNKPSIENLLYYGIFEEGSTVRSPACIVPLSMTRKLSPVDILTADLLKEMIKSVKKDLVTEVVQQRVQIIRNSVDTFTSLPDTCRIEIFNLSRATLHKLLDRFIIGNLNSPELLSNDRSLMILCAELMDILFDISSKHQSVAQEISQDLQLIDALERGFRELKCHRTSLEEINRIYMDVMAILLTINKFDKIRESMANDLMSNMTKIYLENKEESIKLLAALNLSFLVTKSYQHLPDLVTYLKDSLKKYHLNIYSRHIKRNDFLLALGKIFESQDFQITSSLDQTSEIISSSNHTNEISESSEEHHAAYEESLSDKYKLSQEDYENCIRIFATNDMSQENINQLTICIAKLDDKSTFPIFIRNQNPMIFGKIPGLIDEISPYEESYKSFLEKCIIPKDEYENAVNTAVQSVNAQKTSNVELILNKLDPTVDLDPYLLELAVAALKNDMFDILTMALLKCTNVNSHFRNGETFITRIIREKFDEDDIIKSIQSDDRFDINQKSKENIAPIVMAKNSLLKKVFDFIGTLNVDKDVFYYN